MLTLQDNGTYTALHFHVEGRTRHPNVAVFTCENGQTIFGLRHSVTIDAHKYPDEAEQAQNALQNLLLAFANLTQDEGTQNAWADIPARLQARFQRADDDGFADNYQWYVLNAEPGDIQTVIDAGFPV